MFSLRRREGTVSGRRKSTIESIATDDPIRENLGMGTGFSLNVFVLYVGPISIALSNTENAWGMI